jgi:hypothetical protein
MTHLLCTLLAVVSGTGGGCPADAGGGTILFPVAQTRYSWPMRLGGEVGINFLDPGRAPGTPYLWPSLAVEVAGEGLKLNLGGKYGAMEFLPLYSAGISASAMYLWDDEDALFAGIEAEVSALVIVVFGGVYARVSGDLHDDLLYSIGLGAGIP